MRARVERHASRLPRNPRRRAQGRATIRRTRSVTPPHGRFLRSAILNSPYERPGEHWELDDSRQPTNKRIDSRRPASFITPVPKPRRQRR